MQVGIIYVTMIKDDDGGLYLMYLRKFSKTCFFIFIFKYSQLVFVIKRRNSVKGFLREGTL